MESIRVLQLVSPTFGGIESFVFNHYRYMDKQRFQFDFLTQNRALEGAAQYREFQYKVHLLQTAANSNKDLFVRHIREIFKEKYDVLHLNNCFWTGYLLEELAREAGIRKVIVHSHSTFIDEPDKVQRAELLRRHEEIKRTFSPDLATDYWACSQVAADWLFGPQIPRGKIRIMKNAIELERFQFDPRKRERVRDELGLGDALVLGTAGRLSYQKNQAFLIDVFAKFRQRCPRSKLLFVGDGELRGELEAQAAALGLEKDVLLLGWKTNVEDYLQAMDVFLLPSRFEGLGIAVVEAAASGLPCLVSDQVPKDVAFTEYIRHIPLALPAWTAALEEASQLRPDRRDGVRVVRDAGYDIKRQAKILEALYEQ